MAGGVNAAIVPCLKCAGPANRTYEGQGDDHYWCSECGLEFGIDWSSDGPPQMPRWPVFRRRSRKDTKDGCPHIWKMTTNRLDRIRRKLSTLGSYDIEECADLDLGIRKHRFRLGPPLPEAEVAAFEERYGISLPSEYRDFITSIRSSGAGPYYGLLPLAHATNHLDCDDEVMCKRKFGATSCLSDKLKLYESDSAFKKDWLVEVGGINWKERRYGSESWDPFQGTMAICDQGCTYYAVLVLNGPQRGAIWNIELHLSPPMKAPYTGFLDYYEDWVDRMLAKEKQFWYGYPRAQKSKE